MCDKQKLVPIPEFLKQHINFDAQHPEYGIDGHGQECFSMDACIVPLLEVLWAYGVVTFGCCCGHGSGHGCVSFQTEKYEVTGA